MNWATTSLLVLSACAGTAAPRSVPAVASTPPAIAPVSQPPGGHAASAQLGNPTATTAANTAATTAATRATRATRAATTAAMTVAPSSPAFVGADDAPGARVRYATAVLLLGVRTGPGARRFSPVVCAVAGKLTTGLACGEAMPAKARVRMTRAVAGLPSQVDVARSRRDFVDEAGGRTFKAPRGPECCMYNTCVGETIPYFAQAAMRDAPPRVLAVWPVDADIGLRPLGGGGASTPAPEAPPNDGDAQARVEQLFRSGGQAFAAIVHPPCKSCSTFLTDVGAGWKLPASEAPGADGFDLLAVSDLDHDGRLEAVVYERWRNDYGAFVLGNDWSRPAYAFSCGNI